MAEAEPVAALIDALAADRADRAYPVQRSATGAAPARAATRFAPILAALRDGGYTGDRDGAFRLHARRADLRGAVHRLYSAASWKPSHERIAAPLKLDRGRALRARRDAAPAVPLRRHHRDAGDAGGGPRHASRWRTGARSAGVAAETLARQMVRQEPGASATRRTSTSCASRWRSPSTLYSRARLRARRLAFTPTPIASSRRAARRSGLIRWWPPTAPRCSTAPSLDALGRATGLSFAEMISAQRAGHRRRPT